MNYWEEGKTKKEAIKIQENNNRKTANSPLLLKKEQFTFSKVIANMNATRKIGEKGEEITE